MSKLSIGRIAGLLGLFLLVPIFVSAQQFTPDQYFVGEIVSIEEGEMTESFGQEIISLEIEVSLRKSGETVLVLMDDVSFGDPTFSFSVGETVTIKQSDFGDGEVVYSIDDRYRLSALFWIFGLFVALAIVFGGVRGVGALVGLLISIAILLFYIIPQLLSGSSALLVTFLGAVFIATGTMFFAHGFSKKTRVALFSTLLTLSIATLFAEVVLSFASLFGFGSEGVFFLQGSGVAFSSYRGLLLGGLIIGMLGVLDDVTTTQTEAVYELHSLKPGLSVKELYSRGLRIGRAHIASLINTLVLAYAGASLPLFLLFTISEEVPLWVLVNGEFIAEEVVRMLVGSMALIIAVPISTYLAAYFVVGKSKKKEV